MRYLRNDFRLFLIASIALGLALPLHARGRKPPPEKQKNETNATLQEVKDDANTAVTNWNKNFDEIMRGAKKGAGG